MAEELDASQGRQGRLPATDRRQRSSPRINADPRTPELRPCRRRGGLRRQLRALPWGAVRKAASAIPICTIILGCGVVSLDAIHKTIEHGIRAERSQDAHRSDAGLRPHGSAGRATKINDAAEYVLSLSGPAADNAAAGRGARRSSPRLARPATAGTARATRRSAPPISPTSCGSMAGKRPPSPRPSSMSRNGVMPAWAGRLDPETIKELAIYVHSLGGGQ